LIVVALIAAIIVSSTAVISSTTVIAATAAIPMPGILDVRAAAAAVDGRDLVWAAAAVPGSRENRGSGKRNTEGDYRQRSGDRV
jgi:hypothetical protein